MKLEVYLSFDGNCEEAFEFYKSVFGGEFVMKSYFKDGPMDVPEEMKDNIMHVSLKIGDQTLMGSDGLQGPKGNNISISVYLENNAEMDNKFNKLAEGGNITMEPSNQFWDSYFGMLTDKYGINWMFSSPQKKEE